MAWLNKRVAKLEQQAKTSKIVILTHWSPTRETLAIEPKYTESPIISAFSTDLSGEACFRSPKVQAWAFGHTHYNCDFMVKREGGAGTLRLITNQRGYYFAQAITGYIGSKTLEI